MTRDEIIKLAREAGWSGLYVTYNEPTGKPDWEMVKSSLTVPVTIEQIERFAALVAAAEREAAEERVTDLFAEMEDPYLPDIAAAIRARGEKGGA